MPTYVMLTNLTPEGVQTLKNNPTRVQEVNKEVEQLGVKVKDQWATLGQYDFITIVEAPDEKTMAKVSVELGSRGHDEQPDPGRDARRGAGEGALSRVDSRPREGPGRRRRRARARDRPRAGALAARARAALRPGQRRDRRRRALPRRRRRGRRRRSSRPRATRRVDLVIVGPEAPLVAGLVDALEDAGHRRPSGPAATAAELEGSKLFAKELMAEAGVPTAAHTVLRSHERGDRADRARRPSRRC